MVNVDGVADEFVIRPLAAVEDRLLMASENPFKSNTPLLTTIPRALEIWSPPVPVICAVPPSTRKGLGAPPRACRPAVPGLQRKRVPGLRSPVRNGWPKAPGRFN